MRTFMDDDFLLSTNTAKKLYHKYAKNMPIIDYHCHISPKQIAEDYHFTDISEMWLGCDHYKWRQMRANGISEYYITGTASPIEKFYKWVETLEKLIGNPLYHWSHLELKRYFGYNGVLNSSTADKVWNLCNKQIQNMSSQSLLKNSNVKVICTTDDPVDSLEYHNAIADNDSFDIQVLPTWRPDNIINIENIDYLEYIDKLSQVSNICICDLDTLTKAISKRIDFFNSHGCVVADHGLEYVMFKPASLSVIDSIFKKALNGRRISKLEELQFKTFCNKFMAKEYYSLGWVMQLHFGCIRNSNTLRLQELGPDTGFDSMGNYTPASELSGFLDSLTCDHCLPKTILYSLNSSDNAMIDTIIGSFQDSSQAGKLQHGAAWWFNDHKTGITEHLTSLANYGVLGNFVGMLTDSRSLLSYTRHEYFRRLLCEFIGNLVDNGEYPEDYAVLGNIVRDICFNNANSFFKFDVI